MRYPGVTPFRRVYPAVGPAAAVAANRTAEHGRPPGLGAARDPAETRRRQMTPNLSGDVRGAVAAALLVGEVVLQVLHHAERPEALYSCEIETN